MISFFDNFVVTHREKLFLDGFTIIKKKDIIDLDNFFTNLTRIESDLDNFERQSKQKGVLTLKPNIQQNNKEIFINTLFNTNIYELSCFITGQKLYLTNFKHYLTKGKTPALGWHRDTYFRDNKFHGLLPTGYKLAIYGNDISDQDGCTAFIKGSHRIDFNNKYFDYLLSNFTNKVHKIIINKGDAVLFNVNLLHNRLKSEKLNSSRSVTIYGFALSNFYQKNYSLDNNEIIINYFNKQLNLKIKW